MKLIFSGKTKEFTPDIQKKFSAKLAKLSKFVERRGEREAHVIHQTQRHLHKVEVVVNFYDHSLIGEGEDADLETALTTAAGKLEKQVLKLRDRWRDNHRDAKGVRLIKEGEAAIKVKAMPAAAPPVKVKTNGRAAKPKVYKVGSLNGTKPMSVEEAILEIETEVNYFVYRDSKRDCVSVLVRRADGHFDLIES